MSYEWKEWTGAASVTVITLALVILDLVDSGFRRWLTDHAFTTTVVGGVLVLLLTVLIVDRVVDQRRLRDRSQAIAAQAAIVTSQAVLSVRLARAAATPLMQILNVEQRTAVASDLTPDMGSGSAPTEAQPTES